MAEEDKRLSKEIIGKLVVSKTGKKFGTVADVMFEAKTGELIHLVLGNPTPYSTKIELEKDNQGNVLIPFSSVQAIGDFLVISEEDIA
jgi:sporulation protein YlmC with PRC-barrel domain